MKQKTIELSFGWGLADMALGNFMLPCWAVYECLERLNRTDSFSDDCLNGQFITDKEYETVAFVAKQLCHNNILSFDPKANRYKRGEHFQIYWDFFDDQIQNWQLEYSFNSEGDAPHTWVLDHMSGTSPG